MSKNKKIIICAILITTAILIIAGIVFVKIICPIKHYNQVCPIKLIPPVNIDAKFFVSIEEAETMCIFDGGESYNTQCENMDAILNGLFLYPLTEKEQINHNISQHFFYFYALDNYQNARTTTIDADLLFAHKNFVGALVENNVILSKKIEDKARAITKPIPIGLSGKIKISENCAESCRYSYYILLNEIFFSNQTAVNSDLNLARETLIKYFDSLNKGDYEEATKYHGSGYDYMSSCKNDNTNLSKNADILECGCRYLICEKVKNIVSEKIISPEEFEFTVQFIYDDGLLKGETAKSYPYCCGEEPPAGELNIPKIEFEYRVRKIGNELFVTTPILYIP